MNDRFQQIHQEITTNDIMLKSHVDRVKTKLMKEDESISEDFAEQSAIILLIYPYLNIKKATKEQIQETFDIIKNKINKIIN